MNKKIVLFGVVCLLLAAGTYGGVWLYKTRQNTSERTAQTFVHNLQAGNTEQAFARLSSELKAGREQYWRDYLRQFKDASGEASLLSSEDVGNEFNTYSSGSDPQRFVYKFRLQGKDYVMQIVMLKVQSTWVVGAASGTFASQ